MAATSPRAGEASSSLKKKLRALGVSPDIIRRVSIALYEGEINMVIHANGGTIDVEMTPDRIDMVLKDTGKGIPDIEPGDAGRLVDCGGRGAFVGVWRGDGAAEHEKEYG